MYRQLVHVGMALPDEMDHTQLKKCDILSDLDAVHAIHSCNLLNLHSKEQDCVSSQYD